MTRIELLLGDCRVELAKLADASIDAVVCDPPYELGFMGRSWDSAGVSFQPETWAKVLRVLKPGGHLLAFGGTRTVHRIAVAIEDAGFEIRDMLAWMYGSGFPKSRDVSKAIDAEAGAEREVVGRSRRCVGPSQEDGYLGTGTFRGGTNDCTLPATPDAERWQGWGTALKPAFEPIIVARKPLVGTVAANVLAHGTGALNIDGCRVAFVSEEDEDAGPVAGERPSRPLRRLRPSRDARGSRRRELVGIDRKRRLRGWLGYERPSARSARPAGRVRRGLGVRRSLPGTPAGRADRPDEGRCRCRGTPQRVWFQRNLRADGSSAGG